MKCSRKLFGAPIQRGEIWECAAPADSWVVLTHGEGWQREALRAGLGSKPGASVLEPRRVSVIVF